MACVCVCVCVCVKETRGKMRHSFSRHPPVACPSSSPLSLPFPLLSLSLSLPPSFPRPQHLKDGARSCEAAVEGKGHEEGGQEQAQGPRPEGRPRAAAQGRLLRLQGKQQGIGESGENAALFLRHHRKRERARGRERKRKSETGMCVGLPLCLSLFLSFSFLRLSLSLSLPLSLSLSCVSLGD